MPAIKLNAFGGMIPAQDDYLLSDQMAAYAENTWLYSGALEGIREPTLVYTCANALANRVFRVPKGDPSKPYISDSYWLEFNVKDVDVVKAPMDNDTYGRFYWAGEIDANGAFPRYNSRARIAAGNAGANAPYKLGVPAPTVAPTVTTAPSAPLAAANGFYQFSGNSVALRYARSNSTNPTSGFSADRATFSVNGVGAVMAYRNNANVVQYDALTNAQTVDPGFPNTPGASASQILTSRAYAYTWVTGFGEEGPPSPATVVNGLQGDKWDIRLTAPGTSDTALRNLTYVRIYRTITSALGQATYFLVAQLPIGTTSYQDTNTDDVVSSNNQLESTFWTPPPDGLEGMISMPNGMIAGFLGNDIWFCEPYRPHAWPSLYTLSVDFDIKGFGVMGQTLIICTDSATYACTGVNPSSMSLALIGTNQPCTSRGGIVSTRDGVFYPSPNGIVAATPAGVQVVTSAMITPDKWYSSLQVSRLYAALLGGAYYAFGTGATGVFEPTAFYNSAFAMEDLSGSTTGAIIDPSDPRVSFTFLKSTVNTSNVFNDPWTGEVFVIRSGRVYHVDTASTRANRSAYKWTSKVFQTPYRRNMEAMKIYFDTPSSSASNLGVVRLYADGVLKWTRSLSTSGQMMRLPSGFKAEFWQVEIESSVIVHSIQMATTAKDLASV